MKWQKLNLQQNKTHPVPGRWSMFLYVGNSQGAWGGVKDYGGDWRGVNGSLIKFFHKNPTYVPCSKPQAKTPETK
jgi:hypothetical protein